MHYCQSCQKEFQGSIGNSNRFCSRECYWSSLKGRKLSEEHKQKLQGRTHSEETRRKISNSYLKKIEEAGGAWWKSGMKGKKWTESHRAHMKQSILSRTPEKKKEIHDKLSVTFKGRITSDETKEKLRSARMNQKTAEKVSAVEIILQDALKKEEIIFESHKSVEGRTIPDIFIYPNICVYVDGCYWHGCPKCNIPINNFSRAGKYILEVVVPRDQRVSMMLQKQNYKVLRFWEHEIKKDMASCITKIKEVM